MNFIIDKTMTDTLIKSLSRYGSVYKSTEIKAESISVATHPDLQIHFLTDTTAICPPQTSEYYKNTLPDYINIISGTQINCTYPTLCAYNIARVGKYVFCNTKYAELKILEFYRKNNYKLIHINQGYSKCNICPVTDKSFITEDIGIYNTAKKEVDLNVLYIPAGMVSLLGYDYGFIGGATGLAENKVFFSGGISNKFNMNKITDFLEKEEVELVELSDEPLYDYGSIISFK